MKNADKTGSKIFRFIHFKEHAKNNVPYGREQKVEASSILKELNAKFVRDGEYTMSVDTGNKFTGHVKRTKLIVLVAAGRAKAAVAAERDKL